MIVRRRACRSADACLLEMQSPYTRAEAKRRIYGTRTSMVRLSTPVRLTAVTTARDVPASARRCERSHPGSTSVLQRPFAYDRTVHSHTPPLCADASRNTTSPVAVSRTIRALGGAGGFPPSHGDAGT